MPFRSSWTDAEVLSTLSRSPFPFKTAQKNARSGHLLHLIVRIVEAGYEQADDLHPEIHLVEPADRIQDGLQASTELAVLVASSDTPRVEFDFEITAINPHGKTFHSFLSWRALHGAGLHVEPAAMPGTDHFLSGHHAFRERPASMRTRISDRIIFPGDVEDGDAQP
jgi:hypothetical protein